ncbi:threonine/serine ThrE exporter family protein [Demetria terragena]|uniref:threonine/serine ThrE exporter family protein n=1 Tax=Demetria terragena TaxID=63959 RepID=UPI0014615424|nr:threonine/serine exporter family protein [Demetria terragena]
MTQDSPTPPPRRYRPGPAELRLRAGRVLRSHVPPTMPIGVRGDEDGPGDQYAREVIDLALRTGEALLATGASASDVTGTVLRLTRAYSLRSISVDVTLTSITVSYHRGPFRDPVTVMRIVPSTAADFTRLEALQELVRDIVEADNPYEDIQARDRLDKIVNQPHPYQRNIVTVAMAFLGAGITALLGGGIWQILLTACIAATIDRVQRRLALAALPAFFSQAVGAAIPTIVALSIWALSKITRVPLELGLTPSVVIATGVVVLLVGLSVVSTAQDVLDGYYVTAAGRTLQVILLSSGVVAGVLVTLWIGKWMRVPLGEVDPSVGLSDALIFSTLAAFVCSSANAVVSYTGLRATAAAGAIGALAWFIFRVVNGLGMELVGATAVAAIVVGASSQFMAATFKLPSLALATGGIVPLVPGLSVYRGIFEMVNGAPDGEGLNALVSAGALGLALAAGVSLGSLPVRRLQADRLQRKLLRRSAGDARE